MLKGNLKRQDEIQHLIKLNKGKEEKQYQLKETGNMIKIFY